MFTFQLKTFLRLNFLIIVGKKMNSSLFHFSKSSDDTVLEHNKSQCDQIYSSH